MRPSRLLFMRSSEILAGCPKRSTSTPASRSFSVSKSTAELVGAHTRTCRSFSSVRRMACTSVVVLPVPGGPCTTAMSSAARTCRRARFCERLRPGTKMLSSGFSKRTGRSPSIISLNSAVLLFFASVNTSSAFCISV